MILGTLTARSSATPSALAYSRDVRGGGGGKVDFPFLGCDGTPQPDYSALSPLSNPRVEPRSRPSATPGALACGCNVHGGGGSGGGGRDTLLSSPLPYCGGDGLTDGTLEIERGNYL